ncbi:hypothetical protein M422DRAFT_31354, partial [Sphaerobolus stellatus SS14]
TNPFDDPFSSASNMEQEWEVAREFMTPLAVCQTVIPEVKEGGQIRYQGQVLIRRRWYPVRRCWGITFMENQEAHEYNADSTDSNDLPFCFASSLCI